MATSSSFNASGRSCFLYTLSDCGRLEFSSIFFALLTASWSIVMIRACVGTECFVNSLRWITDIGRCWVNGRQIGRQCMSIGPSILPESIIDSVITGLPPNWNFAAHANNSSLSIKPSPIAGCSKTGYDRQLAS